MASKLAVTHLQKFYGSVEAVRDVSFDVDEGEIFGLLGPNGAGKTSAVECIIGLRQPDGGSIQVGGINAMPSRSASRSTSELRCNPPRFRTRSRRARR